MFRNNIFKSIRFLLLMIILSGCVANEKPDEKTIKDSIVEKKSMEEKPAVTPAPVEYSNERFREVTVERSGDSLFLIKGKAQIFEASFSWVIEDGHNELKKGFAMTDAGAPEWGNFSFTVDAKKVNPNSTLHLLLFETSAKDGSRQYELPVLLY